MRVRKISISKFINLRYKEYAIYTLNHRGIPEFDDSLTNVQRLILLSTPIKNTKTISVVGDVIKRGYHHGDSSIGGAINRLAKPFGCSKSLLVGDGFFGTQVKPMAAAARYTSIKIDSDIYSIIKEYKYLNQVNEEGTYLPLSVKYPIGLAIPIIGIAVGYRTQILPRKVEHIQAYIDGKRKSCKPFFKDFDGTISKYQNFENSWLIEGKYEINEKSKEITITSLPPIMKYSSFINKLNKIIDGENAQLTNKSKVNIHINIKFNRFTDDDVWDKLKEKIIKSTKMIVRESIIFVKDKRVLEYASVEDYLNDFKIKNEHLKLQDLDYHHKLYTDELTFLTAKLVFLEFMLKKKRSNIEVSKFFEKYKDWIVERLDHVKARFLTKDEVKKTQADIENYIKLIEKTKEKYKEQNKYVQTLPTELSTIKKKVTQIISDDIEEFEGIEIFEGEVDDSEINELE